MAVSLKKRKENKQEVHTQLGWGGIGMQIILFCFPLETGTDSPNCSYKLLESQSKLTGS